MSQNSHKKSIFYAVDDYGACGWYRCHVPGMEFKRLGHEVMLNHEMTMREVQDFDVLVFQRQWQPGAVHAMAYARSLGKLIVYELDDDLWNLHPSNPGYEAWNTPELLRGAESLLRDADVVTTTTAPLARQLRRFNKDVRILPNMLPQEHWQVTRERPPGYDKVTIGWAGSVSRWRDLALVKDVLLQVLDRYPQVELLIAGDDSNMVFPSHERIRQLKPRQIEQYPQLLAEFDIGLAPVVDSRFNQAKSDLKFLEYGMLGIPTVASHVESYTGSIVNGENGFVPKNDKDWLKSLRRLVEDAQLREDVGRRAKAFAESRTIGRNIGLWERVYGIAASESGSAA